MSGRLKTWIGHAGSGVGLALIFSLVLPALALWAVLHFSARALERLMDEIEILAVYGGDREAFERERDL